MTHESLESVFTFSEAHATPHSNVLPQHRKVQFVLLSHPD
jgi:hypothetical protein